MKCRLVKTEEDLEFISSLFNPKNNKYMVKKKVTISQLKEWNASPLMNIFILEIGQNRIGWFSIKKAKNSREGDFGMMIDEAYRGKGYGRQAMKLLEDQAKKLDIGKLKLQVFKDNLPAIKVYEKSGYKKTHELILMEKKIT